MTCAAFHFWEVVENVSIPFMFLAVLALMPLPASGQTNDVDNIGTSNWVCAFCPFPQGVHGQLEIGSLYVSDDSFKFGDYRGLDNEGVILSGALDLRYWGKGSTYWELVGTDLGLDSRALAIEGGRQGQYEVRLGYDALPKRLSDTSTGPFLGSGGPNLTLPSGWVTAGGSGGMTRLLNSLRPMPIAHDRENIHAGFSFLQSRRLDYSLDYRRETRNGWGLLAGNFITLSALLPEPIDTATDEIDAVIRYTTVKGHLQLAYYGSFFESQDASLTWDNPFTPLTPGNTHGRSALSPDNQAHQIILSGGYQVTKKIHAAGSIAFGRMEQDEAFIPSTINANISATPLPIASLDAKINTTRIKLRIISNPKPKLKLNFIYNFDDRDNKTPQKTYDFVESDTFLAGTRTNLPYRFERHKMDLKAYYRMGRRGRLSGGIHHDIYKRNFQEVSKTEEGTLWFKVRSSTRKGRGNVSLKFLHAERDGDRYGKPNEIATLQNPLLRKYNLANRERNLGQLKFSVVPHARVNVGLTTEIASDDYTDSLIGLTDSESLDATVDLSLLLPKNATLYAFFSHEEIGSDQAGSQRFGAPDWFVNNKDTIKTVGAGLSIPAIAECCAVGLDLSYSKSTGKIDITTRGGPAETFPDLETRLYSAKLYADYRISQRLLVKASYYYEYYKTRDWTMDGVAVDTIPNVLTAGAQSPDYEVSLIGLWFSYTF